MKHYQNSKLAQGFVHLPYPFDKGAVMNMGGALNVRGSLKAGSNPVSFIWRPEYLYESKQLLSQPAKKHSHPSASVKGTWVIQPSLVRDSAPVDSEQFFSILNSSSFWPLDLEWAVFIASAPQYFYLQVEPMITVHVSPGCAEHPD